MDRDMGDLQIKIGVDASGAKQGLTDVSQALEQASQKFAHFTENGVGYGDTMEEAIRNAGLSAEETAQELDKLGKESEEASKSMEQLAKVDLSKIGAGLESAASKLQSFGMAATVLAAPFEIAAAAGIKAFSDFESNMAKIFTLMPDITEQAMGEISQQMKDFSMEMGADLGAAQQAAYDALSAGISPDNMMKFLEVAQKAGVAGMSDVSVSVDGLTSIMNAYGLSVEDATGVSDVMFKSVEKGKIEFDEFAANIGKVAPSAAGLGVVFEDVAAMIAQITSLGVSPSETMTAINSLMKDLASPAADVYQLFEQLTGKAFTDFVKEGGSVIDALEIINDYMIKTGKNAYSLTMNAETAKALSNLTGGNMENLIKFSEEMDNAAGSTEKAYSKVANTLQFAMDKLKAQFRVMGVEIGEALAPTVEKFTKWLSENADEIKNFAVGVAESAVPALEKLFDVLKGGMDAFNGMSPETKGLLTKLLGGGAVALGVGGPAMMGAGLMLSPIGQLVTALGQYKTNALLAAAAAGKLAPATVPIGTEAAAASGMLSGLITSLGGLSTIAPVIIGAAGIVAAGILAYQTNFGDFKTNVDEVIEHLNNAANQIAIGNYEAAGREMANAVADGFSSVTELITKGIPQAIELSGPVYDAVDEMAQGFGAGGVQAGRGFLDGFISSWQEMDASIQAWAQQTGESFKNYNWSQVGNDITKFISDAMAGKISIADALAPIDDINDKLQPLVSALSIIQNPVGGITGMLGGMAGKGAIGEILDPKPFDDYSAAVNKFESDMAQSLDKAGAHIEKFSSKADADLNNTLESFQTSFKEFGGAYEDWVNTLSEDQIGELTAAYEAYIAKYPELANTVTSAADLIKGVDFTPVAFTDGSIFYQYKDGVLQPIIDNPIKIQVDAALAAGEFSSVEEAYKAVKANIENNPIVAGINYPDVSTLSPDAKWISNQGGGTGKNIKDVLTEGVNTPSNQQTQAQNQNTKAQGETKKSLDDNSAAIQGLIKKYGDYASIPGNKIAEAGLTLDEVLNYVNSGGSSKSNAESESSTQANTKSKNENTEANKKNTASKTDEQKASESHQNALDKAIKDMGKWDIQDKWDRKKIEEDRPEFKDYDSIEAYNKAFSQYNDKLDSLTDARAEKEELLAYDLGITTEELRRLASGNKEVKTSGDEVVSTFENLASIDFSKISDPFSQSSAGPSTDLTQSEIIALAATRGINTEALSYDELVKSLINAGVLDKSGKFAYDPNKTFESQYQQNETVSRIFEEAKAEWEKTNKHSSGVAKDMDSVLKSLNEIITGDIDNEDVKKYLDAYKEATGDATEYEEKHTKQLETLLEAYDKASDFQDYYAKAIAEGGLSTDEQTEVSKQYNDILKLLAESGLDATKGIEGLPPALQDLMRALMNIVDNVKGHADSQTGEGSSTKAPFSSKYPVNYEKDVAENSNKLFGEIKSDFASLQSQYAKGAISASTYFDELRKLSIETDTISRSTDTLRGEQRGFTLQFERDIKEIFRKVEAGKLTEAEAVKLLDNNVNNLKSSTISLNSSLKNTTKETKDLSESSADLIKANGGYKDMQELYGLMGMSAKEAEMYQRNYNLAISDGQITYKEAQQTIQRMNKFTDDQTEVSKDNISAMESLMKAQQKMGEMQETFIQLNSDGTISMEDMNIMMEKQAEVNKLVTDATTMAADSSGELPPALQAISDAIQGLVSVCISMAQQAKSAVAEINTSISNVRKSGDWTFQTMSGLPRMADSSKTDFNAWAKSLGYAPIFASGGPVTENGPAYLHQGEYVLRRDEVNKLTSGSPNVNLNINMSNSRFGNSELQKDLPKLIARETRRALARSGI